MTDRIPLSQKLIGLGTAALLAFLLVSPIVTNLGRIRTNESLISEKQSTHAMLEDRIAADEAALSEDEPSYKRVQRPLVAEAVTTNIKTVCNDASSHFSALAIQAACPVAQYERGGGLLHETALLTVSGPPAALLQALDGVSSEAQLDQFRLTSGPETPASATLTLRFSDVSKAPATEEPQQ